MPTNVARSFNELVFTAPFIHHKAFIIHLYGTNNKMFVRKYTHILGARRQI